MENQERKRKGKFELERSEVNQQWYFVMKSGNGEVILQSEGYMNRDGALNAIDAIKELASGAKVMIEHD